MKIQSMHFKETASVKLNDAVLQTNMKKAKGKFVDGRAKAVLEMGNWEDVRSHAAALRDKCLANLDAYLLEFEANAIRRGAVLRDIAHENFREVFHLRRGVACPAQPAFDVEQAP